MSKHSASPWSMGAPHHEGRTAERYNANQIYAASGEGICQLYGIPNQTKFSELGTLERLDPRYAEAIANGRLLSAAPELLALLADAYWMLLEQAPDASADLRTKMMDLFVHRVGMNPRK